MDFHRLTYSILTLDMWKFEAADCEVFCNHTQVLVPALEVAHCRRLYTLKRKGSDVVCQFILCENLTWQLNNIVLVIDCANDHGVEDEVSLARVRVRLGKLTIRQ